MSKYRLVIVSTFAILLLAAHRPGWSRGTGGGGGESRGGFSGGGGEHGGAERGGAPHQSEPGGMPTSQNHAQQPNHPQSLPSDEGMTHGAPSSMNKSNMSSTSGAAAGSTAAHNNSAQHSEAEGAAAGAAASNKNSPQHSGAEGAAAGAAASNRNSPQYSGAQGAAAGAASSNRNSPQYSGAEGAAAGAAASNRNSPQYSGAQGAAAGAAVANRNSPQYSGAQGAAAGAAVANRNSPQYSGAQGAVAGAAVANNNNAAGYGSGFGYVAPSARYGAATAVRGGYNNYGLYGDEWRVNNPSAWAAAGWSANTAWNSTNWNSARTWCGFQTTYPMYYDYGNNVTYQDNNVYVNGANVGTSAQYYDQVSSTANAGALADAPSDGDWLPLGVFALTMAGGSRPSATVQIAVNKQSIVRGNYTDAETGATQSIKGSVDQQTQRLAFTIGDDSSKVIETGLYNLTKDESPALIHLGSDSTEQWLLVRLKTPAPPVPNN